MPATQRVQDAVGVWFATEGRDLPWRATRDPWAVLVAEVMLQQTQVGRVVGAWEDFLERFPDPAACAAAPLADVVAAWEGLGYNRRAVNLHRIAQQVVAEAGGEVPGEVRALRALPGVGDYTARAVAVFAFEQPAGVLDTNTARILARAVLGRPLARREAQRLADHLTPPGRAWAWNQALLDVGATVCTKRAPRCEACPLAEWCRWLGDGAAEPDPAAGTAGASTPQSRFEGSDRQGRGRLVAALRRGPVHRDALARAMGWPRDPARARRVAFRVVADGLAEVAGDVLVLPGRAAPAPSPEPATGPAGPRAGEPPAGGGAPG